ncbi:UDP-4-amino-4,6-dideoxy-N-acetyl-beta-L-altrosamine transaminase [Aliagarivorans taiwanensis]|uniref:UDP-4-amino-4, 6-dideoxy-N-acetyl-beta-L-altrosamine transaminase n=1 Tax=Aliagarivorans taiwanensis TaxID=561966 RepID=UPI000427D139|nr:UDP-4-amino-4,6-dideoxy-N-acetyl-beta-L-altrosamine transaminase [Aliagarivorans taiwanensis]
MIPYGKQQISQQDIDAVVDVLKSDFLTQGPVVERFEQALAAKVGAHYALACNSATSALHIACLALDLGPGDWLWTSPITFVASANCALYCGAHVDFVDIDPATFNLCPKQLEQKLILAEQQQRLPKVVVAVHMSGQSCDMQAIHALSLRFGFKVIEDASHAIGARYNGEMVGGGRYSDITVFSFHPVKIITTAEGGMTLTNDAELQQKMHLARSHGVTRDQQLMECESHGPWYYQQVSLGYNYRMTELQGALGLSQLPKLGQWVEQRDALAQRYDEKLKHLPLILPHRADNCKSAWHLYVVQVAKEKRKALFNALREKGVGVNVHYIPVHLQPYYQKMGFAVGNYPNAERYYESAISLPLHPQLTDAQQDHVISVLEEALHG